MLKILEKSEDFAELIQADLVLVDFYADWCGPCKMLGPNLEALSSNYDIVKVNVDRFEDVAREYGIMSIPALYLFKNGKVIAQKIGYQELSDLKKWLQEV